jgi:uroporphyrinogen III methyltransferase / synthase
MIHRLRDSGATVITAPTIVIQPLPDHTTFDHALQNITRYDWVVLTSPTSVRAMMDRVACQYIDTERWNNTRIAAVGPETATELDRLLRPPDLVPSTHTSAALAERLTAERIDGDRMLLIRSQSASDALPNALRNAGATVNDVASHTVTQPPEFDESARNLILRNEVNWITFASPSAFSNLLALAPDLRDALRHTRLATIGPTTSAALRRAGYTPTTEADPHTALAMADAIIRSVSA